MNKILAIVWIFLVGCNTTPPDYETHPMQEAGAAAKSTFVTKVEGCSIYEINTSRVSHLYLSKYDDVANSAINHTYSTGKQTVNANTLTVLKTEEQILESAKLIEHKRQVLEGLSDDQKQVLGITKD
jgi:hypothetical protein